MTKDDEVVAKCAWRLIPFVALLYVVAYVDRVNVAFAALTMNRDLGFTPEIYGFGAGIFFIGLFLFQVPANVILERVGARRWMACILAAWGTISTANALIQDPLSFYVLRFLLGVAEAGFFPGMLFYLTLWFPQAYRARAVAGFSMAPALSFVIAGPLSGAILEMEGVLTLRGWQWMFLIEGLPACLLAFAVLKLLPDGPSDASWLSDKEKQTVISRLAAEDRAPRREFWPTLRDPLVVAFGVAYFINLSCGYGVRLWLPQIVQAMGFSNLANGFIVGALNAAAIVGMILWSRSSDATGERVWHVVVGVLMAALGLGLACFAQSDFLVLLALGLATVSILLIHGPFWSLTSSVLGGQAAAGGIALITSISSLGGFLGPWMIGILRQETGSYSTGMAVLAVALVCEAMIVLALGRAIVLQPTLAPAKVGAKV